MILYFFAPYFALYLLGWALGVPVPALGLAFRALHVVLCGLVGWRAWRTQSKVDARNPAFWVVVALLFLIPGAYLEYPSDPWSHFERLSMWSSRHLISDDSDRWKFSYFWGWTWLSAVSPAWKPFAVGIYSAFWQLLLSAQFFRFVRRFGVAARSARLQVLAFWVLFGTNLFSFRYYALASTMLAYLAYLQSLEWWADYLEGRRRAILRVLLVGIPLIAFNHLQEVLFFMLSAAVLAGAKVFPSRWRDTKLVAAGPLTLAVLGAASGWVLVHHFPTAYGKLGVANLTAWGAFPVFARGTDFFETISVPGILGILCAFAFFRDNPRLFALALAPVAVLSFPPAVVFVCRFFPNAFVRYRLLFAMPLSIPLVYGVEKIALLVSRRRALAMASLALFLLAAFPKAPWRGRLYFQLYRPSAAASLRPQIETARWFAEHRPLAYQRRIVFDPVVRVALQSYLGWSLVPMEVDVHRTTANGFRTWQDAMKKTADFMCDMPECLKPLRAEGFLLLDPSAAFPRVRSRIGQLSHHWTPDPMNFESWTSPQLFELCEKWVHEGTWTRERVPPYYLFYETRVPRSR